MKSLSSKEIWLSGYLAGLKAAKEKQDYTASLLNYSTKKESAPQKVVSPAAHEFINWAIEKLSDDTLFNSVADTAKTRFDVFLQQNRLTLLRKLKVKLIRGGKEHGSPVIPIPEIHRQLEEEFIDLIGYPILELWNKRKGKTDER